VFRDGKGEFEMREGQRMGLGDAARGAYRCAETIQVMECLRRSEVRGCQATRADGTKRQGGLPSGQAAPPTQSLHLAMTGSTK